MEAALPSGAQPIPQAMACRSMDDDVLLVRLMGPEHLPFVVGRHREYFPDEPLARMGPAFLTAYYWTFLTSPHARAYVAEVDGSSVGFLVGVTDPSAHRRHVLRWRASRLLTRGARGLVRSPRLSGRLVCARLARYRERVVDPWARCPPPTPPGISGFVSQVAVIELAHSGGVGAALIERFVEDAYDAGCARVHLVTPVGKTKAGPASCELRGWSQRKETRTADGRHAVDYEWSLRSRAVPQAR